MNNIILFYYNQTSMVPWSPLKFFIFRMLIAGASRDLCFDNYKWQVFVLSYAI